MAQTRGAGAPIFVNLYEQLKKNRFAEECFNILACQVVREMDIINRDHSIHAITFHDKTGSFAIPVLPAKPVRQSLYSLSYKEGKLRVAFFDTVTNPTIEAYIQNTLIDHTLWQAEEDGSWALDMNAISNQLSALQGRSYLRERTPGGE